MAKFCTLKENFLTREKFSERLKFSGPSAMTPLQIATDVMKLARVGNFSSIDKRLRLSSSDCQYHTAASTLQLTT